MLSRRKSQRSSTPLPFTNVVIEKKRSSFFIAHELCPGLALFFRVLNVQGQRHEQKPSQCPASRTLVCLYSLRGGIETQRWYSTQGFLFCGAQAEVWAKHAIGCVSLVRCTTRICASQKSQHDGQKTAMCHRQKLGPAALPENNPEGCSLLHSETAETEGRDKATHHLSSRRREMKTKCFVRISSLVSRLSSSIVKLRRVAMQLDWTLSSQLATSWELSQ